MHIVFTAFRVNPRSGGVAASILDSAFALQAKGHTVQIYSTDGTFKHYDNDKSFDIVNFDSLNPFELQAAIRSDPKFDGATVLHDHGQWMPINIAAYKVSKKSNLPRVVSPHGMLRRWAFDHKKWKKRIAWQLYGRRMISSADVVHVTSEAEADDLRALKVNCDVRIIPLSIDMPSLPNRQECDLKTVLFMSRIHPVKGINELLDAWSKLKPRGWQLVIAGPDETNILSNRQLPEACVYKGPVVGEAKWQLMMDSDVFVLPTKTENFGLSIAEALYAGLPVITTTNAPWECIKNENFGWWIEDAPEALLQALRDAVTQPPSRLKSMGTKAHDYVKQRFSHERYCNDLLTLYSDVISSPKNVRGVCSQSK